MKTIATEPSLKRRMWLSPSLVTMYLDTLLMAVGFFMLTPLLGIYFIEEKGYSAALTGTILSVTGLANNGLRFFFGVLADRIGYKRAIMLGVSVRIAGYALYGLVHSAAGFALAAFISGAGGSLFHPASYAAYAALTDDEGKSRIFGIREMLSNTGFVLGPILGMFFLNVDFRLVCFASAGMFLAALVVSWLFLPPLKGQDQRTPYLQMITGVFRNKAFLLFTAMMIFMWSMEVQLYLAVPVRAAQVLADSSSISYLYTAGAVFMVLLQLPLLHRLNERFSASVILGAGTCILGLSLFVLGFTQGFLSMLAAVLMYTLGQMLTLPTMNQMISGFSDRSSFASYFGFNGLGLAVGGLLGSWGGGRMYDLAGSVPGLRQLPGTVFLVMGLAVGCLMYWTGKHYAGWSAHKKNSKEGGVTG